VQEAGQVILAGCALCFLVIAGPLATDPRLLSGNMQTSAAPIEQEDASAGSRPGSIHGSSVFINFRPQEIIGGGFTGPDQAIPLVREYIDAVLATGISARE